MALSKKVDNFPNYAINEPVPTWPNVGTVGVNTYGPCGFNKHPSVYKQFEYNAPDMRERNAWGYEVTKEYTEGDVIEVAWCVDNNGDHGGMYSYRLCHDADIVAKFTTPGYIPTAAEKQEAEDCFQRGILTCDGVDSNMCGENKACYGDDSTCRGLGNQWFSCEPHDFGACRLKAAELVGHSGGRRLGGTDLKRRLATAPDCESTNGGKELRDEVRLPMGFTAEHTLISWRWDAEQTAQSYQGCADIRINARGGGTFPPTEKPTEKPSTDKKCSGLNEKKECGFFGIREDACMANGCCWEESSDGSPWCFEAGSAHEDVPTTVAPHDGDNPQCSVSAKLECGYSGINEEGCVAKGCCWEPSADSSPFCYKNSEMIAASDNGKKKEDVWLGSG